MTTMVYQKCNRTDYQGENANLADIVFLMHIYPFMPISSLTIIEWKNETKTVFRINWLHIWFLNDLYMYYMPYTYIMYIYIIFQREEIKVKAMT